MCKIYQHHNQHHAKGQWEHVGFMCNSCNTIVLNEGQKDMTLLEFELSDRNQRKYLFATVLRLLQEHRDGIVEINFKKQKGQKAMKINIELSKGKPYNVWVCDCGTITPITKGLPEPECVYCRRCREHDGQKDMRKVKYCPYCGWHHVVVEESRGGNVFKCGLCKLLFQIHDE